MAGYPITACRALGWARPKRPSYYEPGLEPFALKVRFCFDWKQLVECAHRFKLKFSPDKVDTMVIQAIALLDDLDKEINIYAMRVKVLPFFFTSPWLRV
jgi:hypothetical protein